MLKYSLTFLAGALTIAGAVFASSGHTAVIMFVLGALTVIGIAGALLSSADRIRRAARFLVAFADALQPDSAKPAPAADKATTAPVDHAKAAVSPAEADVADALIALGTKRKAAELAARRAVEQIPAGRFEDLFRCALPFAKGVN